MSVPKPSPVRHGIPGAFALDYVILTHLIAMASSLCRIGLLSRETLQQRASIVRSPAIGGSQ